MSKEVKIAVNPNEIETTACDDSTSSVYHNKGYKKCVHYLICFLFFLLIFGLLAMKHCFDYSRNPAAFNFNQDVTPAKRVPLVFIHKAIHNAAAQN